jgi:hypothetical protein
LTFFNKEFTGAVGATGPSLQTLDVESIMDVIVQLRTEHKGVTFSIKKDGLDITEIPSATWEGRLVPGTYLIAISSDHHSRDPISYSLVIKEN